MATGSAAVGAGPPTICAGNEEPRTGGQVNGRDDITGRWRWAQGCAAAAVWCLPALTLTLPKGLLPFGLLLLFSTLLVPGRMVAGARTAGWPLLLAAAAALFALAVAFASSWILGVDPGEVDSRDRLLVLPWVLLWAWVLRPPLAWLWRGALAGLVAAALIALVQVLGGAERAAGWGNAIVFADVVLLLMVLAVFCRPPGGARWAVAGVALGIVAVVLSGTRGTWPGLLVLLALAVLGSGWKSRGRRFAVLAAAVVGAAALVVAVPGLTERMRLAELHQDIVRIDRGDHDSSAGARLERLEVAASAFVAQPWTGVGFAHFDRAMQRLPECRGIPAAERCRLGHAHNDLAEWAATMGIPGVLALAGLYGVPLWLFLRLRREALAIAGRGGCVRGPATAGAVLVVVFALCGLTQSMFAHQTTTSVYAALVGLLLGLALHEARTSAKR